MCFSAAGSFEVAGLLAGVGAVSLAQRRPPALLALAAIPLLFAIQQAAEGVVWLTMNDPAPAALHRTAVIAFLAFAVVIWPVWMPMSLFAAERAPRRRAALRGLLVAGVAVAAFAAWQLAIDAPVAQVQGHSLGYSYAEAGPAVVFALYLPVYVAVTVAPFFVSSTRWAGAMGAVLALSLVATFVIRRESLVSVWCFFAAILSGVIVLAIARAQREATTPARA